MGKEIPTICRVLFCLLGFHCEAIEVVAASSCFMILIKSGSDQFSDLVHAANHCFRVYALQAGLQGLEAPTPYPRPRTTKPFELFCGGDPRF